MKQSKSLLIVTLLAFGVIFSSCKKELDNSEVVLDLTKTAKITVVVKHETDVTLTETTYSSIPAGNKVTLSIDNSSFNPTATGVWSETFETDASGKIVAEVPSTIDGVTLNVQVQAFKGTQVQTVGSTKTTLNGHFSHAGDAIGLMVNDDKVLEIKNLSFTAGDN